MYRITNFAVSICLSFPILNTKAKIYFTRPIHSAYSSVALIEGTLNTNFMNIVSPPIHSFPWIPGPVQEDKFCKDCKFFVKDYMNGDCYGRCSRYPFISDNLRNIYLVTGDTKDPYTYFKYCTEVRQDERLCGDEGKDYQEK
jgi:hypothetical protein